MPSHRFPKKFEKSDILRVLDSNESLKTVTIKNRLSTIDPKYENVSKDWVRKALGEFLEAGLIEKIKREDDSADYWKIKKEE
jgi:Fe2+ or Zn2+ uptake regulation protein